MKPITKPKVYMALNYIKENHDINVTPYIHKTADSDNIPAEVIVFINKYLPIEQFYTYNKVYENRRKNPLYKNLVNENATNEEMAIALSSLVTQIMIHNKELVKESRTDDTKQFFNAMNTQVILNALRDYAIGRPEKLVETFNSTREVFKKLYKKD